MKTRLTIIAYLLAGITYCSGQSSKEIYVCKPCNLSCDSLRFQEPGVCPHCSMELITYKELHKWDNLIVNEVKIEKGSGAFLVEGGTGHKEKTIRIYYHKPKSFTPDSPILLVIPGSGRDADEYRDSWTEASEKYGVLILSPQYTEEDYDYGGYHLGGLLYNMNLKSSVKYQENSNLVYLDEDKFSYKINSNPEEWIFNDFDRIFDLVINALESAQTSFDIFGHSAGGQILHRLALFHPHSKARRILASNSGSYTLPDFTLKIPFGLKGTGLDPQNLKQSFENELVIFLGEQDNENETGGLLLRSATTDQQGLHRLERGMFFYREAKLKAEEMNSPFYWKLEVVPGVGHDFRKMGAAAAKYLYEGEK